MAKKKKTTEEELQENLVRLQNSYDRWNHLYENGGSDPIWSDGANLDLVRNHIASYKRNIKELCELTRQPLPALVLQDDSPKVSFDYYAKQEIIMANAQDVIARIESEYHIPDYDENSRFVKYFTGYKDSLEKGEWAAVRRLIQSQWQAFLECAAQVYKHKFPNQVMIYGQFPAATYVADEPTWKKVGRGLSIKAVAIVSIAQEKDRVVKHLLYDISQTVGYSLETIVDINRLQLTGQEDFKQLHQSLAQRFKLTAPTLTQAIEQLAIGAVALLNTPLLHPQLAANSIAFMLCQKLGLPYSADFTELEGITDLKELTSTGIGMQACALKLLTEIEHQISKIKKEKTEPNFSLKEENKHATVSRNEQQHTGTRLEDSQEPARQISLGEIRHPAENLHGGTPRGTALGIDHGGHIDDAAAPQGKPTARIETLPDRAAGEKESPPNHQQLHGDSTAHELARPASGGAAAGGTLQSRLDAINQTTPSSNNLDGVSARQSFFPKARFMENTHAIRLLKEIESEDETATPFERHVLSKYAGWGGLSKGFDPNAGDWQTEYAELKELLTDSEYEQARASTLTAFYTPTEVVTAIYDGLLQLGVTADCKILDPAMGTGNFFKSLPAPLQDCECHGVELDELTGRIAKQLHPQVNIQIKGYQDTNYPDNLFHVAVGNVPFGEHKVYDERYNSQNFLIHDYFFSIF